jgi:hypothetical protein
MKTRALSLLACGIALSLGLSCATRQAPSSPSQSPPGQSAADAQAQKEKAAAEAKAKKEKEAADAKAKKEKEAADALAKKEKEAADAKAKKEAADKARQEKADHDQAMAAAATDKKEKAAADAKALKQAQDIAAGKTATPLGPALDPNAPLTREQKLNNLTRRYKNDEITPQEYQIQRAKILAGP